MDFQQTLRKNRDEVVVPRDKGRQRRPWQCVLRRLHQDTVGIGDASPTKFHVQLQKQHVTDMMTHLSDQLKSFHNLLDENQYLKEEATKIKKEKDDIISELESFLIEIKLNLAHCQGREDLHKLSEARLRMYLRWIQDELGGSSPNMLVFGP